MWYRSVKLLWGHQLIVPSKYAKEIVLNEMGRLQLQDELQELVRHICGEPEKLLSVR